MITVTLNRTEFEYDIHSLIKAFFPKEDVELYYTKEAHADEKNVACTNHSAEQEEAGSSHFSIDYADDRISIAWDDAPDGPARRTFAVDFSNRTETKNALKEHLYRLLEEETGQPLPWGTLTGIRPTKIPMQMLDEGKTKEEIASYMKQTYLASDEKINLSIAIAERERALLSRLDYKNGYSLYIGIPFCPSTCLYCSFTSYPLTAWKTQVDAYLDALEKELDYVAAKNYHRKLNSIYIGGGTPTTLEPYQLDRLIRKIRCSFDLGDCLEFTGHAGRPDSITEEKLLVLRKNGISRISINPQTMKQKTLDLIGRHHTVEQTIESFHMARKLGFDNINMDLIAGLPYENYERFGCSFDDLYAHEPDQLQLGFLKVLKGTMMEEEVKKYSILYRNQPPYEVLGTKWLSYDEIILLKGVEELVELYYNSGQYTLTLKYAVPFFESPFRFYEMFSAWYRGKGYHKLNHNRLEKYNILREFLREHIDENEWDTLDEIMLYDMYLRENVKGRPAWAKDTAQYKKEWKALYREQGEKLFPEDVQAGIYDSKRAANQSHIEVFEINIKKFEQSGQVEKKQVFCLFDYSRRNPLNRAARTVEWEIL